MGFAEARRMAAVPLSSIRIIFEKAAEMDRIWHDVIHMELGEPDFDTPEHIKAAAVNALRRGQVHYTSNYGLEELRQAIAEKLQRENQLTYDPRDELLVTVGVAEAFFLALAAFIDPGDEVLVPQPAWLNSLRVPSLVGAKILSIPMLTSDGVGLDTTAVEASITPNTRMIILNSPHNPTGTVLTSATLKRLSDLALEHNLLVLSDEIYERIVYDEHRHESIAALPGMRSRTIVLNGFSKAYSMTGWRLGYVAAERGLMGPILRVHQNLTTCACSFAQAGAVAALNGPQDCVLGMLAEFKRRRDMIIVRLNSLPGVRCETPAGAFYAFADVTSYTNNCEQLARYLLEEAHVAVLPGTAFGPAGEGYIRFSFANEYGLLAEGMDRIARALAKWK
jgi:aminotransferase